MGIGSMIAAMKWVGLMVSKLSALAFIVDPTLLVFVVFSTAWTFYLMCVSVDPS